MLFIVILLCYRIIKKCIRETKHNMDFFITNENIIESYSVTPQEDSAKLSTNQVREESSLSLSLFAVSQESGPENKNSQTRSEASSQLFSSYKKSEFSVFRESSSSEEQRKKIIQPIFNEEMKLKALTCSRDSGEPLKLTFYADTVKL